MGEKRTAISAFFIYLVRAIDRENVSEYAKTDLCCNHGVIRDYPFKLRPTKHLYQQTLLV